MGVALAADADADAEADAEDAALDAALLAPAAAELALEPPAMAAHDVCWNVAAVPCSAGVQPLRHTPAAAWNVCEVHRHVAFRLHDNEKTRGARGRGEGTH